MDNKILLLGDSHTFGDGLNDVYLQDPWRGHSKKSWAYHAFNAKQIENQSRSGCSNDMIYLRLVRYANNKHSVIIMFTFPERIHITRKGFNFIARANDSMPITDDWEENHVAQQINKKFATQNQELIVNHFDDNLLELTYLKNILMCQNFCNANDLKYAFTILDHRAKINCGGSLQKYRDSLYNKIDWKKIFLVDNQYGFGNYAQKIGAEITHDGGHWSEEYHKTFGKLFLDWINKEKVL